MERLVNIQVIARTSGDGAIFVSQSEPSTLNTGQIQSISGTTANPGGSPPGNHPRRERLHARGSPPPSRRWRRLLDAGSLCILAFYLALGVPASVVRAARHLGVAAQRVREPAAAVRARVFGADFIGGVERIRAALETDETYLLIDSGSPEEGAALWVRYELAPRRALFFRDPRASDLDGLRQRIPRTVRWVVVAQGGGRAPELYRRYQYFRERGKAK